LDPFGVHSLASGSAAKVGASSSTTSNSQSGLQAGGVANGHGSLLTGGPFPSGDDSGWGGNHHRGDGDSTSAL
jgi:hypothetical protein